MLGRIAFGKRITPHALDRRQRIILATANGKPGIDHRQREQKLVFLREPFADLDRPVPLFVLDRLRQQHERSEEHTSELQSLVRISYAVFCLTKKKYNKRNHTNE